MTVEKPTERVIDLDLSRSARAFGSGEDLWSKDRERLLKLIRKHLRLLRHGGQQTSKDRGSSPRGRRQETRWRRKEEPVLSIAIFGPSGSGKSSFLYTLADVLGPQHDGEDELEDKKRIYSLPVINPRDFTGDEDFLYAFLAAALEESEERQKRDAREERYESLSAVRRLAG